MPLMNWSAHGSQPDPGPSGIHPGLVVAWSLTGTTNVDGDDCWKAEGISLGRAASETP